MMMMVVVVMVMGEVIVSWLLKVKETDDEEKGMPPSS